MLTVMTLPRVAYSHVTLVIIIKTHSAVRNVWYLYLNRAPNLWG